nr:EOG090X0POW [Ceriodaphnia reticulata]
MTMDTESGRESNNSISKNQTTPPKRSFDVAFLTGVSETHEDHHDLQICSTDEEEEEDLRSAAKKSVDEKTINHKLLHQSAGSPKSAFKKVSKVNNNNNNSTAETSGGTIATTLSLASAPSQNVCAKCNLSFRMTSDLVYHMRSQHRRDASTDPVRQKRQEKLRCPVCGENFRERHHLTRHMTSHEDRELEAKIIVFNMGSLSYSSR